MQNLSYMKTVALADRQPAQAMKTALNKKVHKQLVLYMSGNRVQHTYDIMQQGIILRDLSPLLLF